MKKTNKVLLIILLVATVVFFLSELVGRWIGGDAGIALVAIPYTIAYFVGLVVAVVGIPVSVIGLVRSHSDGRALAIAGFNCLASLVFIGLLFIWPVIKYNIIDRTEAAKHHQLKGIAEQSAGANLAPR